MKWLLKLTIACLLLLAGPAFMAACSSFQGGQTWYNADRSSSGLAPLPAETPEAVVQVYGARAYGWRGYFAVHTWLATKSVDAATYRVHDVTGWRRLTVRSRDGVPDRAWFGSAPQLLADIRGERAAEMIPQIQSAIHEYPYPERYEAWPGPNSNTFTAWVVKQVPELNVALPNTAIGKDYLGTGLVSATPSGSGYQFSLFGYFGLLGSLREGVEINLLGLSFGIDPLALAIKLPGVGQLGLRDPWIDRPAPTTP